MGKEGNDIECGTTMHLARSVGVDIRLDGSKNEMFNENGKVYEEFSCRCKINVDL